MSSNLLDVENLTMKFGGLTAIDDLSFSAKKDHITSIIGPNGAGKTTVFNCLTGFYKATAGSMFLNKDNKKMIVGGRLADYAYYDMDMTISAALKKFDFIKKNFKN